MIRPTINHPRINIFRPQTREAPGREASRTNPTPATSARSELQLLASRPAKPPALQVAPQKDRAA